VTDSEGWGDDDAEDGMLSFPADEASSSLPNFLTEYSPDPHLDFDRTTRLDFGPEQGCGRFTYYRPYVVPFLEWARRHFELVVFSAGTDSYVRERLGAAGLLAYVDHVLTRDACARVGQFYVKDLAALGRGLDDILIVDDNPVSYCLQPELACPVHAFLGESQDDELLQLIPLLRKVLEAPTIREGMDSVFFARSILEMGAEPAPDGPEADSTEGPTETPASDSDTLLAPTLPPAMPPAMPSAVSSSVQPVPGRV